jgi:uncharacterized protein (DUF1810 family)
LRNFRTYRVGDPFDLQRFVDAQARVYADALEELRAGRKRTHWMWFVFPQLMGLGSSPMAQRYALSGVGEARAYLDHPVLGPRYLECISVVNRIEGRTAHDIFGSPDDLKLHSSLTLFLRADPAEPALQRALNAYFGGRPDLRTVALLDGRA